jgi:LysM domain
MVSNRLPQARAVKAGLLTVLLVIGGCSWLHRGEGPAVEPMPASTPPPDSPDALPVDELTATEAATANASTASAVESAPAPADTSGILNPNAPKSYTVNRGDTLWGIASLFLRDPWLWPEVWYINPQVQNPHLIYPGDTLALAYGSDGRPQVRLAQGGAARLDPRLRSAPLEGAIPTIPYAAIAAFLSRPTVLTKEQVRDAAHVIAFREEHVVAGTGHEVYISDLKATPNSRYSIVHIGDELRDPDDGRLLGYEGIYTATALVARPGNPTKALLIDAARETLQGDKVLAADLDVPLNFMLRAPRNEVHGRIISVIDGTYSIGQYQIVVINRGKRHGIDAGQVLAVDQAGATVRDVYGNTVVGHYLGDVGISFAPRVTLPNERAGTLLVFKSFDRVSYGLIIGASNAIHVSDIVRNP